MQDFEENTDDNISNVADVPETPLGGISENIPDPEQPRDDVQPEVIDPPVEQPQHDVRKDSPREEVSTPSRQTHTRSYHTPVFEDDYQGSFEPEKVEVSTVSKENIVLGEVLDKKYDEMVTVQPVRFASFDNDKQIVGPQRKNLDIMQDVGMRLTVELGRTKMKVRKLLEIAKGSIIEIDKMAGDQAELFVCGKLVARGEVIVIEDKFGLRIASIVEKKED